MAEESAIPYSAHVFICTNDRGGASKACVDNGSLLIKAQLKEIVAGKGWKGRVRISTSGCLGLCAKGPNVMIYPQRVWFSAVSPGELNEIIAALERIMADG